MSHGRKITEAIAECQELCSEGNENAADLIGRSVRALHMVAQFDASMEALSGQLEEVENLGIKDGDTVKIYGHQFDYYK